MNKSRELFLLFDGYDGTVPHGYSIVYRHTFPNDEPPYIMVTFWGKGKYTSTIYDEDGETVCHYLIRDVDVDKFVAHKNNSQKDYCDYYLEGIYTRNANEHNLKPEDYARGAMSRKRKPKVKYMGQLRHITI